MQIGMIGLGRMGANMVRRLLAAGHEMRRPRHAARGPMPSWRTARPRRGDAERKPGCRATSGAASCG